MWVCYLYITLSCVSAPGSNCRWVWCTPGQYPCWLLLCNDDMSWDVLWQSRREVANSKVWGVLTYHKLWRTHTPGKPVKNSLTWRRICLWPRDPGTMHLVRYHTIQKQSSPSLPHVCTVIHTPSHSCRILGMVGRTMQSGTWSYMVDNNHWSEAERASLWCPCQPNQLWVFQSPF